MSVLYQAHLCMKYSLGICNFLEEISSLSHSIVFLYFFALIAEEGFLDPRGLLYLLLYRCLCVFSCAQLLMTPWSVACQAPMPMEFSMQEYWSGLPFPSPGDLPNPGIEPRSPALQAGALTSEPPGKPYIIRYAI